MSTTRVALVTDSTIDVTAERAQELGLEIGRVTYVIDGEPILIELGMDALDFIARVDRRRQRASSAGVNAEDFARCYAAALERAPEVLCITMPRKISSTYTFALTAAELFDPGQVEVFDSHQVYLGQTALVIQAAQRAARGWSRQAVVEALSAAVGRSAGYIVGPSFGVLEDIGRLQGRQAGMEGSYSVQRIGDDAFRAVGAAPSLEAAVEAVVEGMARDVGDSPRLQVVISHAAAPRAEALLREAVARRWPDSPVESYADRPNIAFFGGGSGSFGIGFCPLLPEG
jgi:DegV family protein with EDD domain